MKTVDSFLEPETIVIGEREFTLSLIPAIQAQKIYADVIKSTEGSGTLGITMLPSNVAMDLLSWCAVKTDNGSDIVFSAVDQVNSYLPKLENLIKLEVAMIRKNFDFLFNGHLQEVLGVGQAE